MTLNCCLLNLNQITTHRKINANTKFAITVYDDKNQIHDFLHISDRNIFHLQISCRTDQFTT